MVVILSNYGKRMAYKDPFLLDKVSLIKLQFNEFKSIHFDSRMFCKMGSPHSFVQSWPSLTTKTTSYIEVTNEFG